MFGEMGMKCLRTSIAWSRIFPNGDDAEPNEKGLSYYEDMFRELHRWGIEPVITISHFETPLALVKSTAAGTTASWSASLSATARCCLSATRIRSSTG